MPEAALTKDEAAASKAAQDKTNADAKAAAKAAEATAKREADERSNTKSHLNEILLLRGLARAVSPHGSENLAAALDSVANAIAAGRKLGDTALLEVALALKNPNADWGAMVKSIEAIVRPTLVSDRSVTGILAAVERREITVDQGQQMLQEAPKVQTPPPSTPAQDVAKEAAYQAWLAQQKQKPSE
jgi:hypothetical protein